MHLLWITAFVVALDQITKLLVVRYMYVGQSIPLIGDWLKLTFTENPGMAFGITFGPRGLVTFMSLIATALIVLYMWRVRNGYQPYRVSLAFILGGALGNIIDRVLYGYVFHADTLFTGKVVDFIHVNFWRGYIPESVPLIGGSYAALFPIWNVADMAIVCGVVGILLFQQRFQDQLHAELERQDEADVMEHEPPPSSIAVAQQNGVPGHPSGTGGPDRVSSERPAPERPAPERLAPFDTDAQRFPASREEPRLGRDDSYEDRYGRP